MPQYAGTPDYDHSTPERTGVLLINLGTPDAPTPAAVRRYLAEFLSDPRVIDYPRWLWWPILHGAILRVRPRRSAHAYAQVWTPEGSPLLVHTRALGLKLRERLALELGGDVRLAVGMTYGQPGIAQALAELHAANVRRLLVLPLYPQYSGTTTGAAFDLVSRALQGWRWLPELHFITQYHDDRHYIGALADSVIGHWREHARHHLLMSFHGLPKSYLLAGDPYHCQCYKTARLLAERLELKPDEWSVSFQSRVGREEWLQPYTEQTLQQFAQTGPKRVTVLCPGFAVDCLETLEEIALRDRALFLAAGGEQFDYVPALNAEEPHVTALARLLARQSQAWPNVANDLTDTQARARERGATR